MLLISPLATSLEYTDRSIFSMSAFTFAFTTSTSALDKASFEASVVKSYSPTAVALMAATYELMSYLSSLAVLDASYKAVN